MAVSTSSRHFKLLAVLLVLSMAFVGFIAVSDASEDSDAGTPTYGNAYFSTTTGSAGRITGTDTSSGNSGLVLTVGTTYTYYFISTSLNGSAGYIDNMSSYSSTYVTVNNTSYSTNVAKFTITPKAATSTTQTIVGAATANWFGNNECAKLNFTISTTSTDFTVSVTTGSHGYVSPTSVTVPQGTSYTATSLGSRMNFSNGTYIEAHPEAGYNAIWSPSSGIVSGNTTLSVTFQKAYNVYFTADSNGSVSTNAIRVFEGTTYSANGSRLNFSDGQSVHASADTNYQFSSWSPSSGTITDTITFTANFTGVPVTINFNGNGGTPSYNSGTYTYGSTYGSLPTATRSGYTFDGWYTDATGGTRINTYSTVSYSSTTILYAHWSQNSYTVYISAGSHGSVSSSSLTVSYGTTYSTSGDTLTFSDGQTVTATANTNYVVKSWSPSSGTITGSTTISVSFQGKSIRLWAAEYSGQSSYGSVYIHNNTTGEASTVYGAVQQLYVRYGDSVSFVATPNTGYNFESWSHNATIYSYDATYTLTATEALNLSARFLQNTTYTVTLQSQIGGTATATAGNQTITATSGGPAVSMTVVSGTSVTFTATPANQMVFERWESNSGLRYDENPVSQAIATNTVVTAVWNYPPVTVTFDAGTNGGTITGTSSTYTTMQLQYGDYFFNILPGATKQGVSFVGWFTAPTGGTQIYNNDRFYGTTDTTYYAQFSEVYTLSIYSEHGTVTITDGDQTQTITTQGVFTTALQTVTLTASNPDAGYEFSGWNYTNTTTLEVHTSFLNPCTITFDSDLIINGIFNAAPTTALAYFSVGSLQHGTLDDGEVVATSIQKTVDLGEIIVIEGATITIGDVSVTAVPENDYTFDHWAGVSNNQTITGNVYPAAYFKRIVEGNEVWWNNGYINGKVDVEFWFENTTGNQTHQMTIPLYEYDGIEDDEDGIKNFTSTGYSLSISVPYHGTINCVLNTPTGSISQTYNSGTWLQFTISIDPQNGKVLFNGTRSLGWNQGQEFNFTNYTTVFSKEIFDFSDTVKGLAIYSIYHKDTGAGNNHVRFQVSATSTYLNTYGYVMVDPVLNIYEKFPDYDDLRLNVYSFAVYGNTITLNGRTFHMDGSQITDMYYTIQRDSNNKQHYIVCDQYTIGAIRYQPFLTNLYITWENITSSLAEERQCYITFVNDSMTIELGTFNPLASNSSSTPNMTVSMTGIWYFTTAIYEPYQATERIYTMDWNSWFNLDGSTFILVVIAIIIVSLAVCNRIWEISFLDYAVAVGGVAIAFILIGGF